MSIMTAALKLDLISVEEYLSGELVSPVKHEYIGGAVYAMAGARNVHNLIASNVLGALHGRLRGSRCRPYNSDTKIRIVLPTHQRFYYPDVSVICHSRPPHDSYQDMPTVVVEVLSSTTRRIDEGEKRDAYLSIASLSVYLLVEQDSVVVVAFRRTEQGFLREVYSDLNDVIPLPEIQAELPLAEIYDRVEFSPEPVEED
jgi:Uma2 family endonuclease